MSKPIKFHTIWTVLDSHWSCTLSEFCVNSPLSHWRPYDLPDCCLAEYLWNFGFDIPESIEYCLARSSQASLKYRVFGSKIHVYITLC